ncbi:MAG: Rrf2 family transcriptional regulator, partial [Frisingicoccus sp.]|nr:Rrf2 family transcriptional regulator [Frisingicoccus sp.]
KDPSEYTVGDILRVAEGSLAPIACLEDDVNQCPRASECLTLPFWTGLAEVINNYVDSVTLEDLAQNTVKGNFTI